MAHDAKQKPAAGKTSALSPDDMELRKITAQVLDQLRLHNRPPSEVILEALRKVRQLAHRK